MTWASVNGVYVAGWELGSLHPPPGPSEFNWTEKGQEVDGPPSVVEVWMWPPSLVCWKLVPSVVGDGSTKRWVDMLPWPNSRATSVSSP